MRVLVTGASGFLGKNLMEYLPKYTGAYDNGMVKVC